MKLPLWIAAVLPGALIAHGAAYALAGQSTTGSAHAWLAPAMELSCGVLVTLVAALTAGTLLRTDVFCASSIERSPSDLWPRLAFAQTLVYVVAEFCEGGHPTLAGIALQVFVALVAAYALALFSALLECTADRIDRALAYHARSQTSALSTVRRSRALPAFAMAAAGDRARFQRPPPTL